MLCVVWLISTTSKNRTHPLFALILLLSSSDLLSRETRIMLKCVTGLALAAQVSADSLDNVEHVIIFMQENRAFGMPYI